MCLRVRLPEPPLFDNAISTTFSCASIYLLHLGFLMLRLLTSICIAAVLCISGEHMLSD